MKIKVIDPNGLPYSGQIIPQGTEYDLPAGAVLEAALRFKQVVPVKEAPAAPKAPADNGDGDKAAAPKAKK